MKTFDGLGVLEEGGERLNVHLTLDLAEHCFKARYIDDGLSMRSLLEELSAGTGSIGSGGVTLLDVEIPTPNGILRASRLDDLMVVRWQSEAAEARSLGNTGTVTLTLIPRASIVSFTHAPWVGRENELSYSGNSAFSGRHVCTIGDIELQVSGDAPYLRVNSSKPLWDHHRHIGIAISLILGARASPVWAYENGVMRVNLAKSHDYQTGHRLFREHSVAWGMLEQLLRFSMGLSNTEFERWYKAVAFMLEGKSGHSELDIRAVNLFVFLEMFDTSKALDCRTLASMLEISESDAELIKRTRNRLIHTSDSLMDALHAVDQELRARDSRYCLKWFNISGKPHNSAVMFALRLCERINHFILRQANSPAPHYAYEEIIGPRPQL